MSEDPEDVDVQQMWEDRYAGPDRIWSGRPNARLVEFVSALTPGRALDLGCGEGGDTAWLAQCGWRVVATDIADNALRRAAATVGDFADRVDFQRHDLTESFPDGQFDLVSAHFLHSWHDWDRNPLMRRAAAAVAPGGLLLIVDHGAAPPWAEGHHDHVFPDATEVPAELVLPAPAGTITTTAPADLSIESTELVTAMEHTYVDNRPMAEEIADALRVLQAENRAALSSHSQA